MHRTVEFLIVVCLLPVAIGLGLPAAFFVWLDAGAPIFFVQVRPGRNGKPFRMVKFRTMRTDPGGVFQLTQSNDSRVTRSGIILRKLHLDELPQLLQVFSGNMRLIGPRPVPMELYDSYLQQIPQYDARHAVPPGITGLAQVCLGYTHTLEGELEKWRYDVYYIQHRSWQLDFRILCATALKIFGFRLKFPAIESAIKKAAPGGSGLMVR